jgi:hypothetical protein
MHFGPWNQHDGYHECQVSFRRNTSPGLLLRAVLTAQGSYTPLVRDAVSGILLATLPVYEKNLKQAKRHAYELCQKFLINQTQRHTFEEPHSENI